MLRLVKHHTSSYRRTAAFLSQDQCIGGCRVYPGVAAFFQWEVVTFLFLLFLSDRTVRIWESAVSVEDLWRGFGPNSRLCTHEELLWNPKTGNMRTQSTFNHWCFCKPNTQLCFCFPGWILGQILLRAVLTSDLWAVSFPLYLRENQLKYMNLLNVLIISREMHFLLF